MKRRQFLHCSSASALGALLLIPPYGEEHRLSPLDAQLASPGLLSVLGDPQKVQHIGEAYRTAYPLENNVDALRTELLQGMKNGVSKKAIQQQIRADFESGAVVQVKGWMLSRTEARQCALYSLLHS